MFHKYRPRNSKTGTVTNRHPEPEKVKQQITATANMNNVRFLQCATNDTWARDHGAITMIDTGTPSLLDFAFNGWGLKYASELDNQITRQAVETGALNGQYVNRLDFILEAALSRAMEWAHCSPLPNVCSLPTVMSVLTK
ncbi:hypothetical protein KUBF_20710 [Bacteroides finegoldii]|nr:hypothetical protein KUBF_20710 [Bacteroides finegoldii]